MRPDYDSLAHMSELNLDAADHPLDLSHVPLNFIAMLFQRMSISDRFRCALVCKAWAQEATAATHSIILRDRIQDLTCLQTWLEKHGGQVEVLQLHDCRDPAVLTALPCPQLHDLLLRGRFSLDGRVWIDIAAATKLTSISLDDVLTASHNQDAGLVYALTALPELEQLICGPQFGLTDIMPLQKLTKLTAIKLDYVLSDDVLKQLGWITRLQDLSLSGPGGWDAAGCPGLRELKALTRLELSAATPTALNKLSALPGLTHLCVGRLEDLSLDSLPLELSGLQSLQVDSAGFKTMPMVFLASCTQLWVLVLRATNFSGPGRLVASSMLQHLELEWWQLSAADEAAGPDSWQHVLPGPGQLPHLTFLKMTSNPGSDLRHADIECAVSCCSNLQTLALDTLPATTATALARLSGFTSLTLWTASDQQCSSLAQLTGLRELRVLIASEVSGAGLRQLAALEQLTSLWLLGCKSYALREHMLHGLPGPGTDKCVVINQGPAGQPPEVPELTGVPELAGVPEFTDVDILAEIIAEMLT